MSSKLGLTGVEQRTRCGHDRASVGCGQSFSERLEVATSKRVSRWCKRREYAPDLSKLNGVDPFENTMCIEGCESRHGGIQNILAALENINQERSQSCWRRLGHRREDVA